MFFFLLFQEDKLSPSERALSRHHEFNMFLTPPPTSPFLETHFPKLYSNDPIDPYYIKKLEAIKNEKFIFKLEGFNDIKQKGVTTAEILETSQIIRKYCKTKQCTLRKFLEDFREYASRCDLKETVYNVACYIKRKELECELKFYKLFPPQFSFLNSSTDENFNVNDISSATDYLNGNHIEMESVKSDETIQLKLILGVPPATSSPKKTKKGRKNNNKENINRSNIEDGRYSSPQEFFKSFSSNLEPPMPNVRANSYSPLTPKIEDFVRMYDSQNRQKSRSVDALEEAKPTGNVVQTLSFSSQEFFDASLASMKMNDFNKLRKI